MAKGAGTRVRGGSTKPSWRGLRLVEPDKNKEDARLYAALNELKFVLDKVPLGKRGDALATIVVYWILSNEPGDREMAAKLFLGTMDALLEAWDNSMAPPNPPEVA